MNYIKASARSVRDAIAMEGNYLDPEVINKPPPPSFEDMLIHRLEYLDRAASAGKRLTEASTLYQKFLVARMFGAILAIDFILRSLERIGACSKLVLGKNVAILATGEAFYYPLGATPSKDAKARRLAGGKHFLNRQHYVNRKCLGTLFADRLREPWLL